MKEAHLGSTVSRAPLIRQFAAAWSAIVRKHVIVPLSFSGDCWRCTVSANCWPATVTRRSVAICWAMLSPGPLPWFLYQFAWCWFSAFSKECILSPDLAAFLGQDRVIWLCSFELPDCHFVWFQMTRSAVVSSMWKKIRERGLIVSLFWTMQRSFGSKNDALINCRTRTRNSMQFVMISCSKWSVSAKQLVYVWSVFWPVGSLSSWVSRDFLAI